MIHFIGPSHDGYSDCFYFFFLVLNNASVNFPYMLTNCLQTLWEAEMVNSSF